MQTELALIHLTDELGTDPDRLALIDRAYDRYLECGQILALDRPSLLDWQARPLRRHVFAILRPGSGARPVRLRYLIQLTDYRDAGEAEDFGFLRWYRPEDRAQILDLAQRRIDLRRAFEIGPFACLDATLPRAARDQFKGEVLRAARRAGARTLIAVLDDHALRLLRPSGFTTIHSAPGIHGTPEHLSVLDLEPRPPSTAK